MPPAADPTRLRRRPLGRYRYVRLRWRILFAVVDAVGWPTFALASQMRRRIVCRPEASEDKTIRRILIVQLDHMGDAVLSTVMLGPLRRRYPDASIEVLASESNREVFESAPEIDRVHVSHVNRFSRGRWASLMQRCWMLGTFWWGLRLRFDRPRIDLAIDVRGDFPVAVILWLSGSRRRLGWDCGGGGFLLTDRAEFVPGRPEVESRLALLDRLGLHASAGEEPWLPAFRPSRQTRILVSSLFEPVSPWRPRTLRVVIHVGAGTPAKRWPAEHWRELILRLIDDHGADVVLVGSRRDRAVAQTIADTKRQSQILNLTGRVNVDQLAAVIESADVFVGADSGPAHLAAAVGTPTVVLFSGTNNPRQWQPSGRAVRVLNLPVACSPCHRTQCPLVEHPCLRDLRPSRVAAAILELLRPVEAAANREEIER